MGRTRLKPLVEGWGRPIGAAVHHYFRNGRSLCLRWVWPGATTEVLTGSMFKIDPDDCKECASACRKEIAN